MADVLVFPEGMDPVARQRAEWGQNVKGLLEERGWSRKQLVRLVYDAYAIEISEQSLTLWIKGAVAPRPDVQAAIAGVAGVQHHMLFPPVRLEKRVA